MIVRSRDPLSNFLTCNGFQSTKKTQCSSSKSNWVAVSYDSSKVTPMWCNVLVCIGKDGSIGSGGEEAKRTPKDHLRKEKGRKERQGAVSTASRDHFPLSMTILERTNRVPVLPALTCKGVGSTRHTTPI
jgi:hypothetical protein